jgi:hypothetical protein
MLAGGSEPHNTNPAANAMLKNNAFTIASDVYFSGPSDTIAFSAAAVTQMLPPHRLCNRL